MKMKLDLTKLLVLDYLTDMAPKLAEKFRKKINYPEGASLPKGHPKFTAIVESFVADKKTQKIEKKIDRPAKEKSSKRKLSEDEDESESSSNHSSPPKKMMKNGHSANGQFTNGHSANGHSDNSDEPATNGPGCYNCKKPGHFSRECPEQSKCNGCGNVGHLFRDCPDKSDGNGGAAAVCFSCNQTGHFSRECPDKANRSRCFSCNQMGHMSRECPSRSGGRFSGGVGRSFSGTGSNSIPLGSRKSSGSPTN